MLLRVPGLGARAVDKIVKARRHTALRLEDLKRLSGALKRSLPFLIAADHHPGGSTDGPNLRARLVQPAAVQLALF
jgi:predicted DNA-binding helix-hairpin-helix protein